MVRMAVEIPFHLRTQCLPIRIYCFFLADNCNAISEFNHCLVVLHVFDFFYCMQEVEGLCSFFRGLSGTTTSSGYCIRSSSVYVYAIDI